MRSLHTIKFVLATFAATALVACSTTPQHEKPAAIASAPADKVTFPIRSLGVADAVSLVKNYQSEFESAAKLAAQRPTVAREISGLTLEIQSPGRAAKQSVMRFSSLPQSLNFGSHAFPASSGDTALDESFIDIFGVQSVLYWNSRFPYPNGIIAYAPNQARLVSGKLFSSDSKFIVETGSQADGWLSIECVPVSRIAATTVHPAFTGHVTTFSCTTPSDDAVELRWYLEDYARYLSAETRDADGPQTQFKIVSVSFAETSGK